MAVLQRNPAYRPLMILGYADSAHAAQCGRYFRRLGWEVRLVASATEVRRLLETFSPRAIVLDTELPDESGWLACAKIMHEDPSRYVVLLTPDASPEASRQAVEVNAAGVVSRQDQMEDLAEMILGERFAEAV
jgi:DNA-binding NarL/FixJ family response regulator